jgi:hypothetical protein
MMCAIEMDSAAWYIQTKFYEDWYRRSSNIKALSKESEKLQCLHSRWEGFTMQLLRWTKKAWCTKKFYKNWYRRSSNIQLCFTKLKNYNVGINDGAIYDVRRWNGLMWHAICTKFHDDRFKHLSIITAITATILEAVMLVLLIGGIYEVSC